MNQSSHGLSVVDGARACMSAKGASRPQIANHSSSGDFRSGRYQDRLRPDPRPVGRGDDPRTVVWRAAGVSAELLPVVAPDATATAVIDESAARLAEAQENAKDPRLFASLI